MVGDAERRNGLFGWFEAEMFRIYTQIYPR